ncbi:MAG TPA: hypothetical protein EYN91_09260 [Candidatus Melainabacteria bacterium]|jgi:hypothetical protein|nr:hypothetical protein [Candidatus Melainabacteria bacterium]HIN67158.1 hypothetical protein [Candidatus Obscuribacterales bacterium]
MSNRSKIIHAINDLGKRVTVADVVAKTGMPLSDVSSELNLIASDTDANLEVAQDGEIYYCFGEHYSYTYFRHGINRVLNQIGSGTFKVATFLFRLSFGLTLLFSLICLFGIALIIQTLLAGVSGSTESVSGMWRDFFGLVQRLALKDLVHWGREKLKPGSTSGGARQGFLLDCFSFLFGEGDPNKDLEQEKWKLLAQVIRLNEGVVLPEHLSPYTGEEPEDEQTLFAILAKFNGMPQVTSTGSIVYVFPDMQKRSEVTSYALLPPLLEHKTWTFSNLKKEELKKVMGMGALNFIMALTACIFLVRPAHLNSAGYFFLFLCFYALLFLTIPALRLLYTFEKNRMVKKKNQRIREFENALGNPTPELSHRLEEAEEMRATLNVNGDTSIVYSTKANYLEQISDNDFQRDLKLGGK